MRNRHQRIIGAALLAAAILLPASWPAVASFPGVSGGFVFVRASAPGELTDIFLMESDGVHFTNVTNSPGYYSDIDISADGNRIAYQMSTPEAAEIWVVNIDGSDNRRVSPPGVNRYHPSWSPDGRHLAVDSGTEIYRIDTTNSYEELIKGTDTIQRECLGDDYDLTVHYNMPAWSPDGGRMAVVVSHEFAPAPAMDSCDYNVNFAIDLGVMDSGGSNVVMLTEDPENSQARFDGLPDWSPDGTQIVFQRGSSTSNNFGVARVLSGGGGLTTLTSGLGARPRWSPDGSEILLTRDQDANGDSELWVMNAANGSNLRPILKNGNHNLSQDWQPIPYPGLDVVLEPFLPNGTRMTQTISLAQTITVKLRLRNTGESKLEDFLFSFDAPLVIDSQSTADLEIVSGPDPEIDPDLEIEPHEEAVFEFQVTANSNGIAAAHSKVRASTEDGQQTVEHHSLKFNVEDGAELTEALGRFVMLKSMDNFLMKTFGEWFNGMAGRGVDLSQRLREFMTPQEQQLWFGSLTELPLTPVDFATAMLRGVAPEMAAALQPKNPFKGFTAQQLNRAYDESFKTELGKGVKDYVSNFAELGSAAKKGLEDTWSEVMLTSFYVFGNATPEERMQFEAYAMTLMDGVESDSSNLYNTLATEIPNWQANLKYMDEALDLAVADIFLLSPDIQAQMQQESVWRENTLRLAADDPMGFQVAWGERDAEIANLVLPVIFDTLLGGGVFKLGGTLTEAVASAKAAGMLRMGKAAGVIEETGEVVNRARTAIKPTSSAKPHGPSLVESAEVERAGNYLDDVEGATVVQSSDLGDVYELPNLGGVPEVTLEAKAEILAELESEWVAAGHEPTKLAEVLKPSSPFRKANGVAKVELTPQKTGKPAMLDAGAPPDILSEASVWRSEVHPSQRPGWNNLSKARQHAAKKEWNNANKAFQEWLNPEPGSKTARLKECIGAKKRVPLDLEPNKAGLQRFVTAEFEEVAIQQADVEARLIRVKYYEVEVVDVNTGTKVNSKVIVDAPEAVPQTPDADAVALGKVVGFDDANQPIIEPFNRAEREFFNQRYIDKNIKARRKKPGTKGAIPDAAEHGVTLTMDDASAQAAGKLLPSYGVPFTQPKVGIPFLKRIAPFVSKAGSTPEEILATYKQMLAAVESEGGFGQHAIVVTTDSRYLGEVQFARW